MKLKEIAIIIKFELLGLLLSAKSILIMLMVLGATLFMNVAQERAPIAIKSSGILLSLTAAVVIIAPFLAVILSHNAISAEVEGSTIRFLGFYARRSSVIVAKFFARFVFFLIALLFLLIVGLIFGANIINGLLVIFYLSLFLGFIISLSIFCSSFSSKSSLFALLSAFFIIIIFLFFTAVDLLNFNYLSPFKYLTSVFEIAITSAINSKSLINLSKGIAVSILYIAGFLGVSVYVFNKKDL